MKAYNKGEKTRFTVYQDVQVDVEVDFSVEEVMEAVQDDPEALVKMRELLGVSPELICEDFTDTQNRLFHLIKQSYRLSVEDEDLIISLSEKYNYLKD